MSAKPQTLDAVLPLTASDVDRARLLVRSLERFFEPLGTCYVVAPDGDAAAVARMLPRQRYAVIGESELLPEIGYFWTAARVREKLRLVGPPVHGWYVQQLVKLAVFDRIETPFYVTLDADVIAVRETTYEDVVHEGRAVVQTAPPNHPEWNDDAERVLQLPRIRRQCAVTPAILSREVVEGLVAHVGRLVAARARKLAQGLPTTAAEIVAGWRSYLLRRLPWTEYALYHTYLAASGAFDRFHQLGGDEALYGNCVWIEEQFDDWDPAARGEHRFSVVQSATRIPPRAVAARCAPLFSREPTVPAG
jgi:hypothetical protein